MKIETQRPVAKRRVRRPRLRWSRTSSRRASQGPFLHTHDFDEAFYIVEGELVFQVGDDLVTARAGDLAFAPRNVPHTFTNRSEAEARYLLVITPAGFERYFGRMTDDPPEWALQPIPDVQRVGEQIPL